MKRLFLAYAGLIVFSGLALAEIPPAKGFEASNIMLTYGSSNSISQVVFHLCPTCPPQYAPANESTRFFYANKPISIAEAKFYQGNAGGVSMSKSTGNVLTVYFLEQENKNEQ